MRSWMIAYLAGVMIFHLWGNLIPASFSLVLISLAIVLFIVIKRCRWLTFFLLSIVWSSFYSELNKNETIETSAEQINLIATGYICSIPKRKERLIAFELCDASIRSSGESNALATGLHLKLNWYTRDSITLEGVHSLIVRLKKPHGMVNPHGFLYEKWLFRKGIDGVGYVKGLSEAGSPKACDFSSVGCWVTTTRIRLNDYLDTMSSKLPHLHIIKALSIGYRGDIGDESWSLLRNTGTQHLIAISGLHVGLVFGSMLMVMSLVWRLCKWVMPDKMYSVLLRHKGVASIVCALLGALIYSGLAGFSISTQRALIMLLVFSVSGLFRYRLTGNTRLLIAATFVLLIDPNGVLDYGFWLSFLAVWVLFFSVSTPVKEGRVGRIQGVKSFLSMQWVVSVGLSPLLLATGLGVSYTSMLANLVAIPLVGFVTVPLILIGIVTNLFSSDLSALLLDFADSSIGMLFGYLNVFGGFPVVEMPAAPILVILSITLLVLSLLIVPVWRLASVWVAGLVFILLWFKPAAAQRGVTEVVIMDVGQGLSVAAVNDNRAFVYDSGPQYQNGNAASRTLIPYLKAKGVERIEVLVISHGDSDHSGGLAEIENSFLVDRLISGERDRLRTQTPIDSCENGRRVSSGWYSASFYYMPDFLVSERYKRALSSNGLSANNHSCVVKLEFEGISILLMGDLEKQAERHFVKQYTHELNADVLVAGHHGSKHATSRYLLKNVRPGTVVFSSGYKNRFNHPHPDTIQRVSEHDVNVFNTAADGAVVITQEDHGKWKIKSQRSEINQFWMF